MTRSPFRPAPPVQTCFFGTRRPRGWQTAILGLGISLICATSLTAQQRYGLPDPLAVDATVATGEVQLTWSAGAAEAESGADSITKVEISRRILDNRPLSPWQDIGPDLGPVTTFTDTAAAPGVAWEYRVRRYGRTLQDQGFYLAGTEVPAPDRQGTAVLVVEDRIAEPLNAELTRFGNDLTGSGWHLNRLTMPGGRDLTYIEIADRARALKSKLQALYDTRGAGEFVIILVGHLPLIVTGNAAPDGHDRRAFGSDLFYADLDEDWPMGLGGTFLPSQVPDGRIEAQVGRIDFRNVSRLDFAAEIAFLRDYLDRNHAWRHGVLGDLRTAYLGHESHLMVEGSALSNIVGPDAVIPGGHQSAGQTSQWLWGVDFGTPDGWAYLNENHAIKTVFAINFGSYKLSIEHPGNAMTATMAAPNQALAVGWGSRPAWRLHGMALGGTIGEAQMRTVNNGPPRGQGLQRADYLPTGPYPFTNSIWLNLLGDPTLRAFPAKPPSALTVTQDGDGLHLSWGPPADPVAGYRIYRATGDGAYVCIGMAAADDTEYLDPDPGPAPARYMIRAEVLKTVHAGSFYALSQGIFAECCTR